MEIKNASYQADGSVFAEIDGIETCIPADPANRHYRELISQNITPAPYVEPEQAIAPNDPTEQAPT